LGLESTLREQGCSVRRATSRAAAQEALDHADILVVSAAGFSDDDVLSTVQRVSNGATAVVATDSTELAVKAAKLGASTIAGGSLELAAAQIGQALALVDMKRKIARQNGSLSATPPTSGVVQRRSTPLPKEATPDALTALIEAAEGLVPMHRFQRVYVDYALRRFGGNKVHTAAALGIDRRTIQRWARARAEQTQPHGTTTSPSS
jgi:DNA-binding NtrC family response regulator